MLGWLSLWGGGGGGVVVVGEGSLLLGLESARRAYSCSKVLVSQGCKSLKSFSEQWSRYQAMSPEKSQDSVLHETTLQVCFASKSSCDVLWTCGFGINPRSSFRCRNPLRSGHHPAKRNCSEILDLLQRKLLRQLRRTLVSGVFVVLRPPFCNSAGALETEQISSLQQEELNPPPNQTRHT